MAIDEKRTFGAMLQSLEDGDVLDECTKKERELIRKLADVAENIGQAKGEMILKLRFTAEEGGAVFIDADVSIKEPKVKRRRTALWITKDHTIVGENPKQQKLPLREAPAPAAGVRDVPNEGAPRSV